MKKHRVQVYVELWVEYDVEAKTKVEAKRLATLKAADDLLEAPHMHSYRIGSATAGPIPKPPPDVETEDDGE